MEPRRIPRTRPGVLLSLVIAALLVWWSSSLPWWSTEFVLVDVPHRDVGLAGFDGLGWLWSVVVALVAYAVAALPLPARVRRAAVTAGGAGSVAAVATLVVLAVKVLDRDARAHHDWTGVVWEHYVTRRSAGGGIFSVADTTTDGLELAMIATFLLLLAGLLLAVPVVHERKVLIGSGLAVIAGGLLLPVTGWVMTGPGAVTRIWIWLPGHFDGRPAAVVGALLVAGLLAAGLLVRPSTRVAPGWSIAWSMSLVVLWVLAVVTFAILLEPAQLDDPFDAPVMPADEGARLNALMVLAIVLPCIAAIRTAIRDAKDANLLLKPATPGPPAVPIPEVADDPDGREPLKAAGADTHADTNALNLAASDIRPGPEALTLASPGLASPGLASPGLASPGLASPSLGSPSPGSPSPGSPNSEAGSESRGAQAPEGQAD